MFKINREKGTTYLEGVIGQYKLTFMLPPAKRQTPQEVWRDISLQEQEDYLKNGQLHKKMPTPRDLFLIIETEQPLANGSDIIGLSLLGGGPYFSSILRDGYIPELYSEYYAFIHQIGMPPKKFDINSKEEIIRVIETLINFQIQEEFSNEYALC
ncbi:MAG TPA: hypothetical protein VJB94_00525 [Candidatus Nanoarchaeia archaeon]|nr:hypothetical protein [Candidatus Nanoarchaeia archaeon]